MASPQLGLGTGLSSDRSQADRDQRRDASLGALHLGGIHVYCKNMHKHARAKGALAKLATDFWIMLCNNLL